MSTGDEQFINTIQPLCFGNCIEYKVSHLSPAKMTPPPSCCPPGQRWVTSALGWTNLQHIFLFVLIWRLRSVVLWQSLDVIELLGECWTRSRACLSLAALSWNPAHVDINVTSVTKMKCWNLRTATSRAHFQMNEPHYFMLRHCWTLVINLLTTLGGQKSGKSIIGALIRGIQENSACCCSRQSKWILF